MFSHHDIYTLLRFSSLHSLVPLFVHPEMSFKLLCTLGLVYSSQVFVEAVVPTDLGEHPTRKPAERTKQRGAAYSRPRRRSGDILAPAEISSGAASMGEHGVSEETHLAHAAPHHEDESYSGRVFTTPPRETPTAMGREGSPVAERRIPKSRGSSFGSSFDAYDEVSTPLADPEPAHGTDSETDRTPYADELELEGSRKGDRAANRGRPPVIPKRDRPEDRYKGRGVKAKIDALAAMEALMGAEIGTSTSTTTTTTTTTATLEESVVDSAEVVEEEPSGMSCSIQ